MAASHSALAVLCVTAMYPHSERLGDGAFVMHQVEHLRALGHHVDVVHVRGYRSSFNYLWGALEVFWSTYRMHYDVVHVHYGLTGICALIRWDTPMVVTLHGSDVLQGRLQPFVSRMIARVADATIVVSHALAKRYRGTIIPCGVDLSVFTPIDRARARQELGLSASLKYVLFPFNPDRQLKRYDIAAEAVRILSERQPDVSLLPVWNVTNERMPLYYSAADVMILCSDTEGSPTSIKEALACNLPVVATNVGDVPAILANTAGTEVCRQTPASLAAGLERALARRKTIPFDGRAAVRRFDQGDTARAIVNVYRSVLRRRTGQVNAV